MTDYNDLQESLKTLKVSKGKYFTDMKIYFNETLMFIGGNFKGKGKIRGCGRGLNVSAFIPTKSGFVSAEWKNTPFYKMGMVELTEDLFNELSEFIQKEEPNVFVRNTGISTANVIANHITKNGGDPYCTA